MNYLLYNISILMLLFGIILITSYITKATNKQENTCSNKKDYTEPNIDDAFNMRPSQIYNVMFNSPSLWQGYQTIDVKKAR